MNSTDDRKFKDLYPKWNIQKMNLIPREMHKFVNQLYQNQA